MKKRSPDREKYDPLLLQCLRDFGTAIHTSLQRTFSKFLAKDGFDGSYTARIKDPERAAVADKLPTSDACESIFALVRPTAPRSLSTARHAMHCAHLGRTLPPPPEQSKRMLRDRPSLLLFNLSICL